MHQEQRERARALFHERGIARAIFAHPDSVRWLTGFYHHAEVGGGLFMGGPSLVWFADGQFTLIVLDAHQNVIQSADADLTIVPYEGYSIRHPIASVANLAEALSHCVQESGGSIKIGVEIERIPHYLIEAVQRVSSGAITPIDNALVPLRMVKTEEEIGILREAFALTDVAHAAAKQATIVGNREIDVWNSIKAAVNAKVGYSIPLGNDCVVTYRTPNNIGGMPATYEIREDTALIVDLSVDYKGYWSDSCETYYPGAMTAKQAELRTVIKDALAYAETLLKPGAVASAIDMQMREFIRKAGYPVYPHHTGHAVGVSPHEEPRIVPYNHAPLAENMVILVEPGIYFPGETGIRLENAYRITATGCELLTHHIL
jgi:Xaa-Pro aminopeptidase